MRQLNRSKTRRRTIVRARPAPAWRGPALRWGTVALLLVALLGGAWGAIASGAAERSANIMLQSLLDVTGYAGLSVDNFEEEGRILTNEDELSQVLASVKGSNILAVNNSELRERLELLPWVRAATVSRRLPNTIRVTLEEHRPVAQWDQGKHRVLVSDRGEVIPVEPDVRYRRLPLLGGEDAPEHAPELLELVRSEPDLARRVSGASYVGHRRWNIYLGGVEVRLPEREPRAAWRLLAARQRETDVLDRAVQAIDLRQSKWIVLRLLDQTIMTTGDEPA